MMQTINISLIPSDNKPVINVSQYDNGLRVLRFNIFDDIDMEVPHVFDGETVTCNIRKNDNNIVVITGTIETETTEETETSYVQVVLTEQACACVGSNYGEISLSSGDDVIGTCNFKLIVEKSPLAGGVESATAIDNLTTQIESITEQVIGDDYYNKTEVDGLIDGVEAEIPTKTSDLDNDSGFITASDIPTIPTKTSQLTNDSGFITASDIPTIPTKTSQLTNDSGFTTIDDAAIVSDKTWSSAKISDELYALLPVVSTSGPIANFNTGLQELLKSATVNIPADVDGISEINLFQRNGNLWDELWESGTYSSSDGSAAPSANAIRTKNKIIVKGGIQICIFNNSANASIRLYYYDKNNSFIGYEGKITTNNVAYATLPNNCYYLNFAIGNSTTPVTSNDKNISINGDYNDNAYHAYNGSSNSVSFTNPIIDGADVNLLTGEVKINTIPPTYDSITPLNIIPYMGVNNIFSDIGDISIEAYDTIQHYIDTRVNTVSSRSLSMMRTLANQVVDERTMDRIEGVDRK